MSIWLLHLALGQLTTTTSVAPPNSAWQFEFSLESTARWQFDNGDRTLPGQPNYDPTGENFGDLISTLGASVRRDRFQAAVRMDGAYYHHEPVAAEDAPNAIRINLEDRYVSQIQLEFLSASYSGRNAEIVLGDYYSTLGRGLILAVRKVGNVGIDNKLRGGQVRGRWRALSGQVFAGQLNLKNFEQGTGYRFRETRDWVVGSELALSGGRMARGRVYGMHVIPGGAPDDAFARINGAGAVLEAPRPLPWLNLYFEGAGLERRFEQGGTRDVRRGFGLYGAANLIGMGPLSVLLEAKHYDDLFGIFPGGDSSPNSDRMAVNRLNQAPTAERAQQLLLSNEAVTGGRVRPSIRIGAHTPYLSIGRYRDRASDVDKDITAVFGGVRSHWTGGHAWAESGYRGAFLTDVVPGLFLREFHAVADVGQRVGRGFSLEWVLQARHAEEEGGVAVDAGEAVTGSATVQWWEGRTELSLRHQAGYSLSTAYEFYTKTPEVTAPHYFSLGGEWRFRPGSTLRLFYGGQRAGLKCSGGVCRFFPGFEGARVELSMRL